MVFQDRWSPIRGSPKTSFTVLNKRACFCHINSCAPHWQCHLRWEVGLEQSAYHHTFLWLHASRILIQDGRGPCWATVYRPRVTKYIHRPCSNILQSTYIPIGNQHRPHWSALIFWTVPKTNSPPPTTTKKSVDQLPTNQQPSDDGSASCHFAPFLLVGAWSATHVTRALYWSHWTMLDR